MKDTKLQVDPSKTTATDVLIRMKIAVVWVALLAVVLPGCHAEVMGRALDPSGRIRLVDGHLADWELRLKPLRSIDARFWGRETGWMTGSLQWESVLVGPLRAVRDEALLWNFRADPRAKPGVWGGVLGVGWPVSLWLLQTPETVRTGGQAHWGDEGLRLAFGTECDLFTSATEWRGLISLGGPPAQGTLLHDGQSWEGRWESRSAWGGWFLKAGLSPAGVPEVWGFRAEVGDFRIDVESLLTSGVPSGKATFRWSSGGRLLLGGMSQTPTKGPGVQVETRWPVGDLVLSASGEAALAQTSWKTDFGVGGEISGTRGELHVLFESVKDSVSPPGGAVKVAVASPDRDWTAALELEAPGRVAQWMGDGNRVTLEVSHGL